MPLGLGGKGAATSATTFPLLPARSAIKNANRTGSLLQQHRIRINQQYGRQVTAQATPLALGLAAESVAGVPIQTICHVAASCIIAGACIRNVPQLVQCWRQRSTEGISLWSLVTEVSCYAAAVAYGSRRGYACTLWGSDLACWTQDSILIDCGWSRSRPRSSYATDHPQL